MTIGEKSDVLELGRGFHAESGQLRHLVVLPTNWMVFTVDHSLSLSPSVYSLVVPQSTGTHDLVTEHEHAECRVETNLRVSPPNNRDEHHAK